MSVYQTKIIGIFQSGKRSDIIEEVRQCYSDESDEIFFTSSINCQGNATKSWRIDRENHLEPSSGGGISKN